MNGYLILTYINNETVVIHDDLRFDTNLKPELSFAFDALYFEPPNGHCLKVVDGESVPLSEAEIEECAAYCRGYADTADYPVYAWNGDNVCVGRILKSEAEAKGYGFTVLDVPPYPVSRRNGEAWEEIVAIIRDDGSTHQRTLYRHEYGGLSHAQRQLHRGESHSLSECRNNGGISCRQPHLRLRL